MHCYWALFSKCQQALYKQYNVDVCVHVCVCVCVYEYVYSQQYYLNHIIIFVSDLSTSNGPSTRIMIFSQYRDSVNEISEMLHRHRPLVKVMSFVGQSSVGKSSRGFTQKEQLKVGL